MRKILIVIAFCMSGCGYNRFEPLGDELREPLAVNSSISRLKQGLVSSSTVVRGVVVTSDSTGNFYKEFLITDPWQGATLSIRTGIYDIYTMYRQGAMVCVELQGTEVVVNEGLLTVSLASNLAVVASRVRIEKHDHPLPTIATTIGELAKLPAGSLVKLSSVYFDEGGFRSFAGQAQLVDLSGDRSVVVYTSPYASFADDVLPTGSLDVRGVLLFVDGKPQLKLNTIDEFDVLSELKMPTHGQRKHLVLDR